MERLAPISAKASKVEGGTAKRQSSTKKKAKQDTRSDGMLWIASITSFAQTARSSGLFPVLPHGQLSFRLDPGLGMGCDTYVHWLKAVHQRSQVQVKKSNQTSHMFCSSPKDVCICQIDKECKISCLCSKKGRLEVKGSNPLDTEKSSFPPSLSTLASQGAFSGSTLPRSSETQQGPPPGEEIPRQQIQLESYLSGKNFRKYCTLYCIIKHCEPTNTAVYSSNNVFDV